MSLSEAESVGVVSRKSLQDANDKDATAVIIMLPNIFVFIDYTNQLRLEGKDKTEALVETGRTRMRPILMTALTTILAMSTMALGLGEGSDMVQPMAIVTIGGMIYGTCLTLFVVPVIYDIFHRKKISVEEWEEDI